MDGIFDPDGYHKRLPMLSSSSTGIREAHSQSRDVKHSPRNACLHSKFFTMSPVVHELAAMSQAPQIRVMAAKARGASKNSVLPARDTISQIVPPALLTQTSRSILFVAASPLPSVMAPTNNCFCFCCRYRLAVSKAPGAARKATAQ